MEERKDLFFGPFNDGVPETCTTPTEEMEEIGDGVPETCTCRRREWKRFGRVHSGE